ncbi:succinate dehydrogenase assembly factor 2 [Yangia mangrovi]|uniref:FAD assembly factor SdhE n=2 Tax=Alloyangia mangrovi TaxID=1779329 RepID=A0ABT2KRL9_9RHOB|nr:succinate dehydrogenase assembly factor 2 [Alloyangia mangrovi]MCA0940204.1 succinate dehydrogenase assembly factor 2 [Alloyangia pacifica]MCA0945660.1 succinate dehydrogenase assembly factor 2 [Alloyangia pacifica]MCT4372127.1 succinate dehydrogenase assembly factor 2 [Alloyangia mangrovi]
MTAELTGETREHRLKRLRMRSMRRGTKEMDIILVRYADARLEAMTEAELDAYEALLDEYDPDLYQWISGQRPAPEELRPLIAEITRVAANG